MKRSGRTALFPCIPMCSLSCYSFLLHSHLTLPSLSLPRFSGKVEVWIIEDFKLQPVSPAKYVMLSYLPVPHGSCMNMTDSLTHSSCTFTVTIDLSNPPPFLLFSFLFFPLLRVCCDILPYPTLTHPTLSQVRSVLRRRQLRCPVHIHEGKQTGAHHLLLARTHIEQG